MGEIEIRISPRDFEVIRNFIKEKTGIYVRDTRSEYLETRLKDRMSATGIGSFEEYYYLLKYDANASGELQTLINLITVHETSFFRNEDQLKSFKDSALKDLLSRKNRDGARSLRIWSAACSTGEEPLTLAMILCDSIQFPFNWNIEITATDISTRVLDIASKGIYTEDKFGNVPEKMRDKYFSRVMGRYEVKETIGRMIKYRQLNLSSDIDRLPGFLDGMDIIFCRNVFIYFPDDVKNRIASGFYKSLLSGGYLFLGNAESIDIRRVPFRMTFLPGGMVYQKP